MDTATPTDVKEGRIRRRFDVGVSEMNMTPRQLPARASWSTFALVAVYVGHSLVEWGKSGNGQLTETEMAFDPSLTSTDIMAFDDAHMVDEFEAEFN